MYFWCKIFVCKYFAVCFHFSTFDCPIKYSPPNLAFGLWCMFSRLLHLSNSRFLNLAPSFHCFTQNGDLGVKGSKELAVLYFSVTWIWKYSTGWSPPIAVCRIETTLPKPKYTKADPYIWGPNQTRNPNTNIREIIWLGD